MFKSYYKTDFYMFYISEYIERVKDGFFYYKSLELLEKYKEEIQLYFEDSINYKQFSNELFELIFKEKDYFKFTFKDFDYNKKRNFLTYCWIKVRLKNIKKAFGIIAKPFPKKKRNSHKVTW
nr:MAG TPA: hypothetical protein [Caudoviricetes sp.]